MLGKALNVCFKTINHIIIRTTGKTMTYAVFKGQMEPYDNSGYCPAKGWANEVVPLSACCSYFLKNTQGDHRRIVYHIHGGGYVGVMSEKDYKISMDYAKLFGNADTFDIDYRVAPNHVFPAALEDAVEGYHLLLNRGYKPENILVTGDSAGGGLALAMCLFLRDHGEVLPGMLALASPWTDLTAQGESYRTNIKNDALFGSIREEDAPKYPVPPFYLGENDPTNPYISPAFGDYTGMPPMLLQAGSTELLLSDSLTVVKKAKAAGIDAECIVYPGMMHCFYTLGLPLKEARRAWKKVEEFIKKNEVK